MSTLYDFEVKNIDAEGQKLSEFEGRACLLVNVASECGLTPQYDGLTRLYTQYRDAGLEILGFPCNQFGGQEPGSEREIRKFCRTHYGAEFPMFSKLEVKGSAQHPLYAWLTQEETEPDGPGDIAWNFAKFLVDRRGNIVARFAPTVEPCSKEITSRIEQALESR